MSFPKYESYRESGIEWLGEVPRHWLATKLKHVARFSGGGTPDRNNFDFWNGDIPWVSPKDMKSDHLGSAEECITQLGLEYSAAKLVKTGAVLIVVRSGILRHTIPAAINSVPVALNQDMKAVRFERDCKAEFFLRWVQGLNRQLLQVWLKQGATVESVEHEYLANTLLYLPTISEQLQIVEFLDRETAKIDFLIGEQRQLIALLKEKRQAVISQAVGKGLDFSAPRKDSGVEWLGEVPANWSIARLKRLTTLLKDGTHLPPPRVDHGIPLLSVRNIVDGIFCLRDDDSQISEADYLELSRSFVPQPNDVILAIVGATLGKVALIPANLGKFHIQRSVAVLRTNSIALPEWLRFAVSSDGFQRLLWQYVGYSAQPGIYLDTLANFSIPVPPIDVQSQIVRHLDNFTSEFDELIFEADRAVGLLQERRAALISAAVTGKIDVRGVAPAEMEAA